MRPSFAMIVAALLLAGSASATKGKASRGAVTAEELVRTGQARTRGRGQSLRVPAPTGTVVVQYGSSWDPKLVHNTITIPASGTSTDGLLFKLRVGNFTIRLPGAAEAARVKILTSDGKTWNQLQGAPEAP